MTTNNPELTPVPLLGEPPHLFREIETIGCEGWELYWSDGGVWMFVAADTKEKLIEFWNALAGGKTNDN